jgi:signal transduction histidine kinase
VDLANAARRGLRRAGDGTAGRPVRIETDLRPAPVLGDAALLERLVANLVENAVAYNHDGGWVRVRVGSDAGGVELEVANSGPQVPAEALPDLFEPFRRATPERTGAGEGLGLAIVRAVALAHGGAVAAAPGPDGGLVVSVSLPQARG